MVQRVQYLLEDDIDGGEAAETIEFALDGVTYEIDLNEENAATLREAVASYVAAGRRLNGRGRPRSAAGARPQGRRNDLHAVRQWARDNGFTVSDRGRVKGDIQDAYDKAHSS